MIQKGNFFAPSATTTYTENIVPTNFSGNCEERENRILMKDLNTWTISHETNFLFNYLYKHSLIFGHLLKKQK